MSGLSIQKIMDIWEPSATCWTDEGNDYNEVFTYSGAAEELSANNIPVNTRSVAVYAMKSDLESYLNEEIDEATMIYMDKTSGNIDHYEHGKVTFMMMEFDTSAISTEVVGEDPPPGFMAFRDSVIYVSRMIENGDDLKINNLYEALALYVGVVKAKQTVDEMTTSQTMKKHMAAVLAQFREDFLFMDLNFAVQLPSDLPDNRPLEYTKKVSFMQYAYDSAATDDM